jgi:hypothetical protein
MVFSVATGMGEVYRVEDTRFGHRVALKRPSEAWLAARESRTRHSSASSRRKERSNI